MVFIWARSFISFNSFLMSLDNETAIKENPMSFVTMSTVSKNKYLAAIICIATANAYPSELFVSNGNLQKSKNSSRLNYCCWRDISINSLISPHWEWQFQCIVLTRIDCKVHIKADQDFRYKNNWKCKFHDGEINGFTPFFNLLVDFIVKFFGC